MLETQQVLSFSSHVLYSDMWVHVLGKIIDDLLEHLSKYFKKVLFVTINTILLGMIY